MRWFPLLLTLTAAGCLLGNDDRVDVSVSYMLTAADSAGSEPDLVRGGNLLTVNHYFATPSPCYEFQSSAEQSATVVELRIRQTFSGAGPGCPDSVATWRYTAILVGVEPGVERLGLNFELNGQDNRTEYPLP